MRYRKMVLSSLPNVARHAFATDYGHYDQHTRVRCLRFSFRVQVTYRVDENTRKHGADEDALWCAGVHSNFRLVSVPVDGSERRNTTIRSPPGWMACRIASAFMLSLYFSAFCTCCGMVDIVVLKDCLHSTLLCCCGSCHYC